MSQLILNESKRSNAWVMLVWLLIAQISVAMVGRSLAPLGPFIEADLSLTKAQVGLFPAALFLGQTLVNIPVGILADRLGSRKLLLGLCLCLGLFYSFFSFSNIYWLSLIFVVIGGFGYGAMHPTTNRSIIYWFSRKQRGTAMGIKQMGITAGSALAALILIPVAAVWGWRVTLLSVCLLLIAIGVLTYIFYRDNVVKNEKPQRLKWNDFILLFKNKILMAVSISAMGLNGVQMTVNTYLVFFAYEKLQFGLVISGIFLVVSELSGSMGRIAWGIISDRFFNGRRIVILLIISFITTLCCLIMAMLPAGISLFWMIPLVVVFGFSASGFNAIWMNSATEAVLKGQSGLATGFSVSLGSIGVILVPPLFGLIVDMTNLYMTAWIFLALLMIGVIVILSWAERLSNRQEYN